MKTKELTNLEERVEALMEDFLQTHPNDLYMICKNITKAYGDDPSEWEIMEEIELFYNS